MINYSLSQKRNPQDPEGPRKWYPTAQSLRTVGVDELAAEIVEASALTEGDVLSAIRSLENRIIYHLQNGEKVALEKLGSFHLTISSEGVDNEEDFNEAKIRKVNVRYTPGDRIENAMNPDNLAFKKAPRRADVEAIGKGGEDAQEGA